MRRRPAPKAAGVGAPCETHNPQEEASGRGVVEAVLQPRSLYDTWLGSPVNTGRRQLKHRD
jgi:hypothetical protein